MKQIIRKTKTKLLLLEFKEKFPTLNNDDFSEIFHLHKTSVKKFFKKEYLIIPSKINNKFYKVEQWEE